MTQTPRIYAILAPAAAVVLAIATVAFTSAGAGGPALSVNPGDFSTTIDNPLFPLSTLGPKVFEGEEVDPDTSEVFITRLESTVLPGTSNVAGVEVLVVEEKAYLNSELVEVALDYYAQHSDGTVYYFGENVDNYINNVIDNHDGTWLAGEGSNEPGIIMPAAPFVGQVFQQENAPGIAEDGASVLALNETVGTTAGEFTGCLKTEDTNPLEPPPNTEIKFHCPGVGFVRADAQNSFEELISYSIVEQGTPTGTPSPTGSPTASPTASPTGEPTATATPTATGAQTGTPTPTATPAIPDDEEGEDDDDEDDEDDDDEDDDDDTDDDDGEDADEEDDD